MNTKTIFFLSDFSLGHPEVESIREYAKKTFGWTNKKTDEVVLPVMKKLGEKKSQQSLHNYFKITDITSRQDLKVSKRVRTALEQMSGDPDALTANDEVVEKKKPKKKSTKVETTEGASEKTKTRRKRKVPAETETKVEPEKEEQTNDKPSTSNTEAKKVILPDNNAPIPQREKNRKIMETNKLKAIALLKTMKMSKK